MAPPAQLRISVWEGGCLWIGRTSEPFEGSPHAHHALQLSFLLEGEWRFRAGLEEHRATVLLVDADLPHSLEMIGRAAYLFIDPESRAGRTLREQTGCTGRIVPLEKEPFRSECATLDRLWSDGAEGDALQSAGAALLARVTGSAPQAELDPRVQRLIAAIEDQPPGPVDFATASAGIYLSPSRLRHLFAEQVGLPFKSFVLWRRLMKAVAELGAGATITAAAHQAGFADGAHFSRTFRRTFGLSANSIARL